MGLLGGNCVCLKIEVHYLTYERIVRVQVMAAIQSQERTGFFHLSAPSLAYDFPCFILWSKVPPKGRWRWGGWGSAVCV